MRAREGCNSMSMCRSLHCTPFKGSNTPAVFRTALQQYHSISVPCRSNHLAQTCSSNSRQKSSKSCYTSHPTAAGRLGFVGAIPTTLKRRLVASAAASDSGNAASTTSTAYSKTGSAVGNTAGYTSDNSSDCTLGSAPSSIAGSTPGSTAGSTPGITAGNTPGSTPSSTAGRTPSNTPGSTPGGTAGSTAGNPFNIGPSSGTKGPGAGLAGMLRQWHQDSKKLRQQLQSLGLAGVVAYGLFNTAYYTVAFLVVWFTVANVPAGLGLQAAARKAAEVFALVWAGSQVTKLLRAGGALAFAPVVDQGLTWAVQKFRLNSKQQALWLVVTACGLLAAAVFGFVVVVHA